MKRAIIWVTLSTFPVHRPIRCKLMTCCATCNLTSSYSTFNDWCRVRGRMESAGFWAWGWHRTFKNTISCCSPFFFRGKFHNASWYFSASNIMNSCYIFDKLDNEQSLFDGEQGVDIKRCHRSAWKLAHTYPRLHNGPNEQSSSHHHGNRRWMKQNAGAHRKILLLQTGSLFKFEFLLLLSQADAECFNGGGLICV